MFEKSKGILPQCSITFAIFSIFFLDIGCELG